MSLWRCIRARIGGVAPVDWLIVGLGNPGPKFRGTRHNLGREAVALLAKRWAVELSDLRSDARYGVAVRDGRRICLAIPVTYMNESGRAAAPLARFFKVAETRMVVVVDDLDLPLGTIRLRAAGGTGGHRGLASVARSIGTEEFPRLRIGIGRPPPGWDPADYVLTEFEVDERPIAAEAVDRAAHALEAIVETGLEPAMTAYNG
jgi:PTH1 family peptidyl-tRNA hydrolase